MPQHPQFILFSQAFREGRFEQALQLIDSLIAQAPESPPLHWHRANCLEKLGRDDEIGAELDMVLASAPDYAPAIIKRVQYTDAPTEADDDCERLSEAAQERCERERAERARHASLHAEAELRRALSMQPDNVDGLYLLSTVLRHRDDGSAAEADALLDRAIVLAPERADLLDARATIRRAAAMRGAGDADDAETVTTYSGMRYHRSTLEAALADYEGCWSIGHEYRHAVRMGMVLHDLGRYDEALARYDEALATVAADSPARGHIVEMRARSENGGAGEREQMARLLESALIGDGEDRSMEEDIAAQALFGAAGAIRAGKSVQEALDTRISDDPETMMAIGIAQQIINLAHEPAPQLEVAQASDYPAFQRRFAERTSREAEALGLHYICDAEAHGLFAMLGQHVLIRFFADDAGETGIAAFAMQPKWPGWIRYLVLRLTGNWKIGTMVECVSQFDDGTHLSTQPESASPFEYGGLVQVERLPRGTSVEALVARHRERVAAHKAAHPHCRAMVARDLEGMERRWLEGQKVKRDYRASIGYASDTELRQLLGDHHERLGTRVREQLAVLAADYAN